MPQAKRKPTTSKRQLRIVQRPANIQGIEEMVWVDPTSLSDNPDNWKHHPQRQLSALDAEMQSVGFTQPLAYNRLTNRLIDGHGRKQTDFVRSTGAVPVVIGSWTQQQERQILLHLDTLTAMFETDRTAFDQLMTRHQADREQFASNLQSTHQQSLEHLNNALETHRHALDYGFPDSYLPDYESAGQTIDEDQRSTSSRITQAKHTQDLPTDLPGPFSLKTWHETPSQEFTPLGPYDIPLLRPDRLWTPNLSQIPPYEAHNTNHYRIQTWVGPETPAADLYHFLYQSCSIEQLQNHNFLVSYYTFDEKLDPLFPDPTRFTARLLALKPLALVSPNFSLWPDCPQSYEIWQTYRSFWLARYWQEAGLLIIPDILLSETPEETWRYELLPPNPPCVSVQLQTKGRRAAALEDWYASSLILLHRMLKQVQPKSLLLYHGPDVPAHYLTRLADQLPLISLPTFMSERKRILSSKEYLSAHSTRNRV